MTDQKPYGSVLLKAVDILDFLLEYPSSSLKEISDGLKMTNSTVLKILDTLLLVSYVSRDEKKNYRIGAKFRKYFNQDSKQVDLVETTLPYLERLQHQIDETIHLGILNMHEILYINKLDPKNQVIQMSSKIGITRPLYCSAMGKAVLAKFSAESYQKYLSTTELKKYTVHTMIDAAEIETEIEKIRETNIAYDNEEVENDIFCVGAALIKEEDIVGAFSISVPKYRITDSYKKEITMAIIRAKQEIEAVL
ncbi:IclR family transcriptional regulator [Listeria weihenstephanensis]|uniref:IclR family transcriptional regulator n=2 Tax=Listeria weihenstephanensis TaxID=1006155 RepID=A0A1S7FRA3_9LIST|nr:IclR family transcriptional regulator [Listeria weihenstephanensis]